VAKFNQALATRLAVPLLSLYGKSEHPLVSIKCAESPYALDNRYGAQGYDLFLHDVPSWPMTRLSALSAATRIFAANASIAEAIRPARPDVIAAFCPSTLDGILHRGGYRVLTFGMGHKLVLDEFRRLRAQLEQEHPDYTLSLSMAVHEGASWVDTFTESMTAMREIFGSRLRVLGFLADDALAKELQDCDAVAAFFQPALRENNTSAWAALAAGKKLYTNLDAQSPTLTHLERYSWEALLTVLR
jgi:hypothetical protein